MQALGGAAREPLRSNQRRHRDQDRNHHQPQRRGIAVRRLDQLNRCECRRVFEERFTDKRMASDYLRVYERLAKSEELPPAVGD